MTLGLRNSDSSRKKLIITTTMFSMRQIIRDISDRNNTNKNEIYEKKKVQQKLYWNSMT